MSQRSAMSLAAGVLVAVLSATLAFAISADHGAAAGDARPPNPIVRTVKRTVTVHRRAKAASVAPVLVSSRTFAASAGEPQDAFEHDHGSAFGDD